MATRMMTTSTFSPWPRVNDVRQGKLFFAEHGLLQPTKPMMLCNTAILVFLVVTRVKFTCSKTHLLYFRTSQEQILF